MISNDKQGQNKNINRNNNKNNNNSSSCLFKNMNLDNSSSSGSNSAGLLKVSSDKPRLNRKISVFGNQGGVESLRMTYAPSTHAPSTVGGDLDESASVAGSSVSTQSTLVKCYPDTSDEKLARHHISKVMI